MQDNKSEKIIDKDLERAAPCHMLRRNELFGTADLAIIYASAKAEDTRECKFEDGGGCNFTVNIPTPLHPRFSIAR